MEESKTPVIAIIALVCAFIIPPLGFILGIVALVKANQTGNGKGLSIASIIVSIVFILPVLLLIGGFAYFGVLSPEGLLPSKCELIGFGCTEVFASGDTLTFYTNNYLGFDVRIDQASVQGCSSVTVNDQQLPVEIRNGQSSKFMFSGCPSGDPGDQFVGSISFSYENLANAAKHTVNGDFSARYE